METLVTGTRRVYEAACNWKLIVENFSECYHCPSVHPELTTVLPEFKRGQGTLHQAGYGAAYGEGIGGFTFDGRPGLPPLPGLAEEDGRRYYGLVLTPNVFLNLVGDHVILHWLEPIARRPDADRLPLAVRAGGDRRRVRHRAVGRAVPPHEPAGLRDLRALPARHGQPVVRPRREPRPERGAAARLPRRGARRGRRRRAARMSAVTSAGATVRPDARGDRGAARDDRPPPARARRADPPGRAGRAGSVSREARCGRR